MEWYHGVGQNRPLNSTDIHDENDDGQRWIAMAEYIMETVVGRELS